MNQFDAIAVGEALVDVVISPSGTVERPGGSPMNVAIGLARLGLRTGLLTSIGSDDRGTVLEGHLRANQVELLRPPTGGPTSTSAATLGESGAASYDFSITWDIGRNQALPPVEIVHAGSIGSYLEPGGTEVEAILQRHRGNAITSYDPNIRPSLIASDRADSVRLRVAACAAASVVVKLSDEDADWLFPREGPADVLERFLRAGATLAIMTLGGQGAVLMTSRSEVTLPADPVEVVDTIGAGDSYMAAVLAGLLELDADARRSLVTGDQRVLDDSILSRLGAFAARCAAITVSRAGANPPRADELLPRPA